VWKITVLAQWCRLYNGCIYFVIVPSFTAETCCSACNDPGAQDLAASQGKAGRQAGRKNFILHHAVDFIAMAKVLLFKL
jgi:hypothetical protein